MSDAEYNFISEWPADTAIDWWNEGRKKLNVIIKAFNQWQVDGFDADEAVKLRAQIVCGIQTFASRDGGGGWREELDEMQRFVDSTIEKVV